ncbi:MAG: glutamate--tRNA ligase [Bacteroidota bacterium]
MKERARFAPSPTGPLHIGGVRTALFNFLIAKKSGGDFILRIEDTDVKRTVPGAEEHIINSLKWLGIEFDEGPIRQSKRVSLYTKKVKELLKKGYAYYAFDTQSELEEARQKHGAEFKYNHRYRMELFNSLSLDEEEVKKRLANNNYVVRMLVPDNEIIKVYDEIRGSLSFNSNELEDKVILKSDGMPTYHLANVVDDNDMKITSVIRGEEWLSSLPSHILLYNYFNWNIPKFFHLPLILKSEGSGKLSKRDAEQQGHPIFAVQWEDSEGFKESGFTPEGLINYLALLGWSGEKNKELYSLEDLIKYFNSSNINKSGARFDYKKALWVNHLHLKNFEANKILGLSDNSKSSLSKIYNPSQIEEMVNLIKERLNTVKDIDKELSVFYRQPKEVDAIAVEKINRETMFKILTFCKLNQDLILRSTSFKENLMKFGADENISFGHIMKTLRLALVGSLSGPDLFKIIDYIGAEEALQRINNLLNKI